MNFVIETNDRDRTVSFRGSFSWSDVAKLRLDPLDRALIGAPVTRAHDHLQTLEMLFRRYYEQQQQALRADPPTE